MGQILVYMTTPDRETAVRIGQAVLERRLAACVNIIAGVESMYWWDGAIQREGEVAVLAKTRASLFEDFKACVLGLHPYEVPCVVALDIDRGHEPFLHWIDEQTLGAGESGSEMG